MRSKLVLSSTPGISSTGLLSEAASAAGIPSSVSWSVRAIADNPSFSAISISSFGVLVPSEYVE